MLTAAFAPAWVHLSLLAECAERVECALKRLDAESNLSPRLKMHLHIPLAMALLHSTGLSERTGTVVAQALEFAESLDDAVSQFQALWGMWTYELNPTSAVLSKSVAESRRNAGGTTGSAKLWC